MRTDENNNPAAFTVDIAKQARLILNREYVPGTPFPGMNTQVTAKLLGDPIALTIKVIDTTGYYTKSGSLRWVYIAIPKFIWDSLTFDQKRDVVGFHYAHEGGTKMRHLFPQLMGKGKG